MKICLSCEGVTDTQAKRCGNCGAWLLSTDAVHYPTRRGEVDAGNPLLGTIIDGKYRLLSVLGRGGLGTVYRAQHIGSLVTVALKLLHPRFAERPAFRRALLPEARRAATVVHQRCARLLDVGEGDQGITYLAMELVEGQTLDEVLQQGALPPSHAVEILLQVAEALAAVHDVGLVHCDLSPRNVMVTASSGRLEVKVLDFGIARSMTMAGHEHARGELWGFANPAFSAPELLSGQDVDARADVYSLGTLAWLMLTGDLPVAETDKQLAADAVRQGRLLQWPGVVGVPARLRELVRQCVRTSPAERPASAREVHRRLQMIRSRRRPVLARVTAMTAAVAVVVALVVGDDAQPPVFLRPRPGSLLELLDGPMAADRLAVDLQSSRLDTLGCHYAGFAPERLQVEIVRNGEVLLPVDDLQPTVDKTTGTLLLSTAQAGWSKVVQGLRDSSRDGPVDIQFVVPGVALLGSARLRLDDTAPTVTAVLDPPLAVLRSRTKLMVVPRDNVAVSSAFVDVTFDGGATFRLPLPVSAGAFELGQALADPVGSFVDLGSGRLVVTACDRAGNTVATDAIRFTSADVQAPHVDKVTGPAGESYLILHEDRPRWRIRLSSAEPGCRLLCRIGGRDQSETMPLPVESVGGPVWLSPELPLTFQKNVTDLTMQLVVVDAAGNETSREFAMAVRNRNPQLEFEALAVAEAAPVLWSGGELVIGQNGGELRAGVGPDFGIVGARLDLGGGSATDDALQFRALDARVAQLRIAALAAGRYALVMQLTQAHSDPVALVESRVPLLVLPVAIEVRVPVTAARFLPGLEQAGLFTRRGDVLVQGAGWRIAAELRPYIKGWLWVGAEAPVPLAVHLGAGPIVPEIVPKPGHNLLAIELVDVLGRAARLVDDNAEEIAADAAGRQVVADFWWRDEAPQLIGEVLLVEYGQPAGFRMRLPLPFEFADRDQLRLGIAQAEEPATQVVAAEPGRAIALFEVPFDVWKVAAQLADQPREAYADQIERTIPVYLATPAGRYELTLPIRTTRSTLSPMRLGELVALPAALADIRLLPVLAPPRAFAEPMPVDAPPRAMFRPQEAVTVHNMPDILLQDRELTWREARGLADVAASMTEPELRRRCVHQEDVLGLRRLAREHLLPDGAASSADQVLFTGVDFYQAWSMTRLLGVAVAGDPELFRLPLGCELELAAFGRATRPACNGVAANGGAVGMMRFLAGLPCTSAALRAAGDVVPTTYGVEFLGLDFGVREWVLDIPHIVGAEMLLKEWTGDHAAHLRRVMSFAQGTADPPADPVGPLRILAVVRGLAFGERAGLIDSSGADLVTSQLAVLPASVPGVLRAEQLRRDGEAPLGRGRDARLQRVGFRVAGTADAIARLRGYR